MNRGATVTVVCTIKPSFFPNGMVLTSMSRSEGEVLVPSLHQVRTQELQGELDEPPHLITAIRCHHCLSMTERDTAVQVCHDMLTIDGTFVNLDSVRPLTDSGVDIGLRKWGSFQVRTGKSQEERRDHLARYDMEYFPITIKEHSGVLRGIGFRTVEPL